VDEKLFEFYSERKDNEFNPIKKKNSNADSFDQKDYEENQL